jgi:hypothetical protein
MWIVRNPFGRGKPAQVSALPVGDGERIAAWALAVQPDVAVAATQHAIYLGESERLAWDDIVRATWEPPLLTLVLDSAEQQVRRLNLPEAGDLPALVRTYVTDSVVVSEQVEVAPGAGARLVARRAGLGGEIRWSVIFDEGLDAQDPALQGAAMQKLAMLRETLGI